VTAALRLGIAGLGTVGAGTLRVLQAQADLLAERAGRAIEVTAVSAREQGKDRGVDLGGLRWVEDAVALAKDPEIDLFVELIGGSEGVAKEAVEAALGGGKDVVTANKALLAHHGAPLARLAEDSGAVIAYEGAVAGGIPAIKSLREGLAGNAISRVFGILNGTCNYILTSMRETGRTFDEVLEEAQALGYAEADPSFDVDGIDAAHKLALLTALAFGCEVDFDSLYVQGIRNVSAADIAFADELGYRIKLLGIASRRNGGVEQRVHPCMIPEDSQIASVEGVFNAILAEGDAVDSIMTVGRGAGAGPTASAVVADIVDIARGNRLPAFGLPADKLAKLPTLSMEQHEGSYYMRLTVVDRPGVIADIAAALRDEEISVEAMLQRARAPESAVPVVITTHETTEARMNGALRRISALDAVAEPPQVIRIESL
jgi:homoserine dehydrogenase